jgi:glycosyltransferase involved in cell wall biosynthesis
MTMIWALKRSKIPIGLICHNIADHDANGLKATISRRMIGMADAYLVHSLEHAETLRSDFPARQVEYHPIPIYGHYPPAAGRLPKRGRLELLFFGFIRPYKGLDVLLDAMRIAADPSIHLTVVGEHWGDASALEDAAAALDNVELELRYMSDEDAAERFQRADFVVLPYTSATPSAVASLAYHYDTPIIASRVNGLSEVIVDGETGILVAPNDAAALADAIRNASREQAERMAGEVAAYKRTRGWDSLRAVFDLLADRSGRQARPAP